MANRDQPLEIEVTGGRLVISIGIDALMNAVQAGDDWDEALDIVDADAFAAQIAERLENEQKSDGSTDIILAFDRAASTVIENGSEAVRSIEDEETDEL